LLGEARLHDDANAKEALNKVLWQTTHTPTTYALALKDFVESWSSFSNIPLVKDLDLLPHEWWDLTRIGGRTFAPITRCILVQMCIASSCEQNWNPYSFIHNKVWNQLTSNRTKDLV
jgi:hypothetical protein